MQWQHCGLSSGHSRIEEVADLQFLRPKILMTFFSHCHLLVTFFAHYLLHICTLASLPSLTQLWSSPLHTYGTRGGALL